MPRHFRWQRVHRMLFQDSTSLVECFAAFVLAIIPGLALACHAADIPLAAEWYFYRLGLSQSVLGWFAVALGMAQIIFGGGTEWYRARALIAFAIGLCLIALISAYWLAGHGNRQAVWMMCGAVFGQGFLAWRNFHEQPLITRDACAPDA